MPPKKDKTRQATVEPESPGTSGENSGETSREIVPIAGTTGYDNTTSIALIPGFSQEQVTGLITMISAVVDARLEQRLGNFDTNRQQNSPFPSIQGHLPQPEQQVNPPPNIEIPQQNLSHTNDSFYHTNSGHLRAEDVGYFDPEYQLEQGISNSPIINAGKHVFYKDVYFFTDRLKDLAVQRGEADVKVVMTTCFRGSALMWYSMELTELERTLLRDTELDKWYTTLIGRFKTRTAVALSQLVGQTYSLADMKRTSPRAFIQQMLHLAKSAEFHSTFNQLALL